MSVDYHTQNGLNAYKTYIALKQHFTKPDYDYFKYNGSTNASFESYKKRKDAIFFEMLGKKSDLVNFIAYNLAMPDPVFPKELATHQKCVQRYERIKFIVDSLSYWLSIQLTNLNIQSYGEIVKLCTTVANSHPEIVRLYLAGKIDFVLLCCFDEAFCLTESYDRLINEDIIWPKISLKVKKLRPFLNIDRNIVMRAITNTIGKQTT